jgi:hypothetical protein
MADGTLKVGTITTSSGSGTITLGQSGETLSVPSGATLDMSSGTMTLNSSMKNTPYFKVGITEMSLSYNTNTKITYNIEKNDTDNAYDTSNSRFTVPTGEGGTYHIGAWYRVGTGTDSSAFEMYLYKNGSLLEAAEDVAAQTVSHGYNSVAMFGPVTLSAGDYLECYAKQAYTTGSYNIGYSNEGRFFGYKLIGI